MELISKHFWVILLGVYIFNAVNSRKKFEQNIQEDPTLEDGYNRYILWNTIIGSIPMLLIGLGIIMGELEDIFEIFNFRSEKWIIKLFYTYSICVWIFGFWWIYFQDGAEFIEKHKGVYQINFFGKIISPTSQQIKHYYPFTLLFAMLIYWWISNLENNIVM